MKYLLIGLLRAYRLRDQPALRAGLPLPPVLLGLRPRGGDRARQPARQLVRRPPARRAATPGQPVVMTRYPPRCRIPIRLKEPECSLSSVTRQLHHDAAVLRHVLRALGLPPVFGAVFGPRLGLAWVLSIVGLTLVIRAALIPLFVKQIKSSRNMQLLQPKVKELQKKYGHDRERLAQETMALYKETGTNPFASCLPILLQMPIFLALFRLIDNAAKGDRARACSPSSRSHQLQNAKIFGAQISVLVHQGRRQRRTCRSSRPCSWSR